MTSYLHLPQTLYQTTGKKVLSHDMAEVRSQWEMLNPDWTCELFDDEACDAFIESHFSREVFTAYQELLPGAYRADFWRCCVLYIHGGVYADINKVPLAPLSELLTPETEFTSVLDLTRPNGIPGIYNAFIAAKPKHPFLAQAISLMVKNIQQKYYGDDPHLPTGPQMLGTAINQVLGRGAHTPFDYGFQVVNGHAFTLWYHCPERKLVDGKKTHWVYLDKQAETPCFYRVKSTRALQADIVSVAALDPRQYAVRDYHFAWNAHLLYKEDYLRQARTPLLKRCLQHLIKHYYRHQDYAHARKLLRDVYQHRMMSWAMCRLILKFEVNRGVKRWFKKDYGT